MKIFETHAHYDDSDFDEDRDQLISTMLSEEGALDVIVNVGASLKGCEDSLSLASRYEKVYAAVGVHPEEVESLNSDKLKWLEKAVNTIILVVAIGEIGLDYHYPYPGTDIQKYWFCQHLNIATNINKPVLIHSSEACPDPLECLKQ